MFWLHVNKSCILQCYKTFTSKLDTYLRSSKRSQMNLFRGRFYQHFTCSFCTCAKIPKAQKIQSTHQTFCAFGICDIWDKSKWQRETSENSNRDMHYNDTCNNWPLTVTMKCHVGKRDVNIGFTTPKIIGPRP